MENNAKKAAFPMDTESGTRYGLTKEEYAAVHLSTSPPTVFMQKWSREHRGPQHPGSVTHVFKDKECADKRPYTFFIQNHFDLEDGKWDKDASSVPQQVIDDVSAHVRKIEAYYEESERLQIQSIIDAEVAWRREIAASLMESFE